MTDIQSAGAALFLAASLGMTGVLLIETFAPKFAPPFMLFWMVGTVGLCMIAVGGDDE